MSVVICMPRGQGCESMHSSWNGACNLAQTRNMAAGEIIELFPAAVSHWNASGKFSNFPTRARAPNDSGIFCYGSVLFFLARCTLYYIDEVTYGDSTVKFKLKMKVHHHRRYTLVYFSPLLNISGSFPLVNSDCSVLHTPSSFRKMPTSTLSFIVPFLQCVLSSRDNKALFILFFLN